MLTPAPETEEETMLNESLITDFLLHSQVPNETT